MNLRIGGKYRHKETGTIMVMVSGDTISDEYVLKEALNSGGLMLSWEGDYWQLDQDFVEAETQFPTPQQHS